MYKNLLFILYYSFCNLKSDINFNKLYLILYKILYNFLSYLRTINVNYYLIKFTHFIVHCLIIYSIEYMVQKIFNNLYLKGLTYSVNCQISIYQLLIPKYQNDNIETLI